MIVHKPFFYPAYELSNTWTVTTKDQNDSHIYADSSHSEHRDTGSCIELIVEVKSLVVSFHSHMKKSQGFESSKSPSVISTSAAIFHISYFSYFFHISAKS